MTTPATTACCPAMPAGYTTAPIETSSGIIKEFHIDNKDNTLTSEECKSAATCTGVTAQPVIPFTSIKPLCDGNQQLFAEICGEEGKDRWVKLIPWWFWVVFGLVVLAMIISMIGMFVK